MWQSPTSSPVPGLGRRPRDPSLAHPRGALGLPFGVRGRGHIPLGHSEEPVTKHQRPLGGATGGHVLPQ